ncbi:large ribosomal subunit protein bL9m [Gouania willdenowi]|uniref:Large ribosomal subunit protein bL9m n=1 Tax=Gouania willdenowi TaxID=441366 RepID=A0A8C5DTM5_GOUWI|nr:39S ribosomal protein L9, mitochondrial [Gouania willdenowi]
MWSYLGHRFLQELLVRPPVRGFSLSAAQNTVIVERWWKVPLSEVGQEPRLHPRRHKIYKNVEDTKHSPQEKMELILTQNQKLGGRGDTVLVKKSVGRNKLLPQGLAVYPTPENKQMFAEDLRLLREGRPEDRIQTRTGQMTVEFLKSSTLNINKMPSEEFQLNKEVLIRQFSKKLGVVVPPHALNFPFEPVKDLGEYWCEVTVNGIDTVRVPISLLPYRDRSARHGAQTLKQAEEGAESVPEEAEDAVSRSTAEEAATTTQTEQNTTTPPENK